MSAVTLDSFIEVLKKSGLISEGRLQARLAEIEAHGSNPIDLRTLAKAFIDSEDITSWQAEKLLSGKHKGFFLGKYKLLKLLGRGGMSAVYLAEHILMKRRCAIKVLPTNRVHDSSYLGRFHLEAQAAAALDDPNIMRAYDVDHFVDGKTEVHFLVMEYVEGRNLHEIVTQDGPLSPLNAAEYIRQSASGLHHAHHAGLVHRDIKPGNLLLDLKGTVKILDMGLAKFFDESDENSLTIQHDERVLGTADFLAPEQAINSHNVDARADIYSLGCTLYFLLTTHAPFEMGSLAQRLMAHQTQEPPPVTNFRQDVPESLIAILQKMMAKKADDRYQTARDVAIALKNWISEHADQEWMDQHERQWENKNHSSGTGVVDQSQTIAAAIPDPPVGATTDEFGDFLTMIGQDLPGSGRASLSDSHLRSGSSKKLGSAKQDSHKTAGIRPNAILPGGSGVKLTPENSGSSSPTASNSDESGLFFQQMESSSSSAEGSGTSFSPSLFADSPPSATTGSSRKLSGDSATKIAGSNALHPAAVKRRRGPQSASSSPLTAGLKKIKQNPLVAGGVVLALLAGLFLTRYLFTGGSPDRPEENGSQTATSEAGSTDTPAGSSANQTPPKVMNIGADMTVGPNGTFATLPQAIKYLIQHNDPFALSGPRKILIQPGFVLDQPLELLDPPRTFPDNLLITSEGSEPVIWKGTAGKALVHLKDVEGLTLENILFQAQGAEQAVKVEGRCPGTSFKRCQIQGYSQVGMQLTGVAGLYNTDFRLEANTFQTDQPAATALRISPGEATVENLVIEQCRFLGAQATGILAQVDVLRWVKIKRNQFHELQTGLAFEAIPPLMESLTINNNTFHRCGTGILLAQAPTERSANLGLLRNLFVGSQNQDLNVAQGYQQERWQNALLKNPGGMSYNWTTRSPSGDASNSPSLFADQGRTAITDLNFVSVDPYSSEFLKPANGKGKIPAAPQMEPYVGAVAP